MLYNEFPTDDNSVYQIIRNILNENNIEYQSALLTKRSGLLYIVKTDFHSEFSLKNGVILIDHHIKLGNNMFTQIYIGSINDEHDLDISRIIQLINDNFQ
jgi:hypothetical protein